MKNLTSKKQLYPIMVLLILFFLEFIKSLNIINNYNNFTYTHSGIFSSLLFIIIFLLEIVFLILTILGVKKEQHKIYIFYSLVNAICIFLFQFVKIVKDIMTFIENQQGFYFPTYDYISLVKILFGILVFIATVVIYKQEKIEADNTNYKNKIKGTSSEDDILKYKELLDIGAITQEEFEQKKKELLGL